MEEQCFSPLSHFLMFWARDTISVLNKRWFDKIIKLHQIFFHTGPLTCFKLKLFKRKRNLKMLSFTISIENSAIERKLVFTSKTCKILTTWPILMEFWYKNRQSMLFKRRSVWNSRYMASLSNSLTESGISGWWPGSCLAQFFNKQQHQNSRF